MTQKLTGGYVSLPSRAVKTAEYRNSHTSAMTRPLDGNSLEALNWVQKTPWAINRPVLDVAIQCSELGVAMEGFPSADNIPLPAALPGNEFDSLTPEAKKKYMSELEGIRSRNKAMEGMRARVYRMLNLAKELSTFPAMWFPHFCDFRGRVYPLPQDLHTQGDSLTKGLLTFAEAAPLGANGQWWMYVALANAFGQDKIALQARVDWTDNHLKYILATAADPMGNMDFWAHKGVDSPWEALALCFEIANMCQFVMVNGTGSHTGYQAAVPIRLDATCSGIQHLSAMMRDPLSARAVNVNPSGQREDIYGDVCKKVNELLSLMAANGDVWALRWMGHVERKTVKRAVMTTPYGVTERGISEQLVDDGFCNFVEDKRERRDAAAFLKDMIVGALDANIGAPRAAMQYFQDVARSLAERDIPLTWTTPAGFTVRQAYFETQTYRVKTLGGDLSLMRENPSAGLVLKKQCAAAAPNVVHSFDAAHLCLTAIAMKKEGVRDLAFVHDSFGAHAGNVDTLSHHIREEFVNMYSAPALENWRNSVIEHAGVSDIPELPTLGNLDVNLVRESEFFFS